MHSFPFLRCIGRALLMVVGAFTGGMNAEHLLYIAEAIWDWWRQEGGESPRQSIEALAQASGEQVRTQAEQIALELAADQPRVVQQQISQYLTHVPAMIRRSLRRPSDPTGRTVPPGLVIRKAEDLLPFLPQQLPRFVPGDRPLPGVDWELVELLGVGGFGEVWKARNPHFDGVPPAALKFCLDPSAKDRLLRHEAAVLNQVLRQGKHPGIVQLLQTYLTADPPCLAYEYVEGGDLAGLIHEWHEQKGGPSPEQAARIISRLASTIGFAHRLEPPIVHRDLKPANILVQRSEQGKFQFKIADFGIGGVAANQAIRQATVARSQTLFQTSVASGTYTPLYASPQQMRGDAADPRDDVYSLGVIWYQLLAGDLSSGRPGGSRWRSRLAERGMSQGLLDLLESCFEENPDDRPRNAADLAERLEALLGRPDAVIRDALPVTPPPGRRPAAVAPLLQEAATPPTNPAELEIRIWQAVQQQDTLNAYQKYLATFPEGRYVFEARLAVDRFMAEKDDAAWQTVQQQGTLEAYEQYLAVFPDGRHNEEARDFTSSRLRGMLLEDGLSPHLRRRYLAARSKKDEQADASSMPLSWWLSYMAYALAAGLPSGAAAGLAGAWVGSRLEWAWIFRVSVQAVAGAVVGLAIGMSLGALFQRLMVRQKERAGEDGGNLLGGATGLLGGLIAGAVGGWLGGLLTGAGMGLFWGLYSTRGEVGKEFGPLPYGAHLLNDDDLRKRYLGVKKEAKGP